MHLVVTAAGQEREADVVLDDVDATVGDLVAVVAPGAPEGIPLTVDGRPVAAEHRLDEVGLVEGARLGVGDPTLGPVAVQASPRALAVVGGVDSGRSVPFGAAGSVLVGRHPDCDLVVDDPAVSAHHARLDLAADGTAVVHDVGSSNGAEVDGVPSNGPRVLQVAHPGDLAEVGPALADRYGPATRSRTPSWSRCARRARRWRTSRG